MCDCPAQFHNLIVVEQRGMVELVLIHDVDRSGSGIARLMADDYPLAAVFRHEVKPAVSCVTEDQFLSFGFQWFTRISWNFSEFFNKCILGICANIEATHMVRLVRH
jgi:hypothetical protein